MYDMITSTQLRIFDRLDQPRTVGEIANPLGLSVSTVSEQIAGLVWNGLAEKKRVGKSVEVKRSESRHAQILSEIYHEFARLPIDKILSHSSLKVLALLNTPRSVKHIALATGLSRTWIYHSIKFMGKYGIVVKRREKYEINPKHSKIQEFVESYFVYANHKIARELSEDAIILWQRGDEFLFKTKEEVKNEVQETAITKFPSFGIPMISETKYYFYSKRGIDNSDILMHVILVDPKSQTYNAYACIFYQKVKPENLIEKAEIYDLRKHVESLIKHLKTENFFMPWKEYESLARDYGVTE